MLLFVNVYLYFLVCTFLTLKKIVDTIKGLVLLTIPGIFQASIAENGFYKVKYKY